MSETFELPMTPGLVSDYKLEVAEFTESATTPSAVTAWTVVRGIQEITPPAVEKNLEDDSDIDSGAWGSQLGTGLEYTIEGTAKRPQAGSVDPGQEILKKAGKGAGQAGMVWWKLTSKLTGEGEMGLCDSTFTEQGGARTDLKLAEFTLTGRGAIVDVGVATEDWAATTAYDQGDRVNLSGSEVLIALNGGMSDAEEPTAPTSIGEVVVDADIAWKRTA
ncbi:phage tail tube protein [Brevibacterium aurantiacum]|uniref:Uncharacterized protein n=1 Tax=Brevibacterium aurantiacum TaxID=273384 RepID=A0A556C3I1_BREAU|nr:hypothetical protein [Brevibacterium aurantiacum]TSI11971.1 hypothetical protein FO013_21245 [Brevibacterium aurantiacum]